MKAEEMDLRSVCRLSEDEARDLLEGLRWPKGPVCPHCQSVKHYKLTPKATSKSPARKGLYKCATCRKQFTVTVGTIFENSHIPLNTWIEGIFLLCSSKKGMSTHQLHRMLKITYKAAWFMTHRIRHAMKEGPLAKLLEGAVEVDETYVGGKDKGGKRGRGSRTKTPVVVLVERDGNARTRVVDRVTAKNLHKAIKETVDKESVIMTDEWRSYRGIGEHFLGGHEVVNHGAKEYARGEVHTNTAESFFALLKRGVYGSFHHVSRKHLHRYSDEFAFRWNHRKVTDGERTVSALGKIEGKRLKYREHVKAEEKDRKDKKALP
jgi:transposase-like protein